MRLTRSALTVAATALTSAVLFAAPAFAADTAGTSSTGVTAAASDTDGSGTPVDEMSDEDMRVEIFRILAVAEQNNDTAVHAAATAALRDGSTDALRAFLETGYPRAQAEDDSVWVFRVLAVAAQNDDQAVHAAAVAALEDGSPQALRAFRETGYRLAQAEDDSVAIFRILADPDISSALRAAAEAALDDGSPEALRYFIEHGQYEVAA
ncbi:hypothetical protein ACFV6E_17580 [Streptomyces sp. NPDC059785]|uniref:hypothetical protein n=1 Tax=unclassified Streptomyces TaxID=2593676 RepID=UPI0036686268